MAYSFGPWPPTETFFLVQIQSHLYKSEIPNSYTQERDLPKKKKKKKLKRERERNLTINLPSQLHVT